VENDNATTDGPFRSTTALQAAHAELLASVSEPLTDGDTGRVERYLKRVVATGAVLDLPRDRRQAQGLIDYWVATLLGQAETASDATRRRKPELTLLAAFDPATVRQAAAHADALIATLTPQERVLVRRVVLRLVRLRPDAPIFDPIAASRGALHDRGQTPQEVDAILERLQEVGVVHITRGENALNDQVMLRSPGLLEPGTWPTLRTWLDERQQFRGRAVAWASAREAAKDQVFPRAVDRFDYWVARKLSNLGRWLARWISPCIFWVRRKLGLTSPADLLLDGEEAQEARTYHDRNPAERQYLDESQFRSDLTNQRNRVLIALFALMLLAASIGWLWAGVSSYNWHQASQVAIAAKQKAERERDRGWLRRGTSVRIQTERIELEEAKYGLVPWPKLIEANVQFRRDLRDPGKCLLGPGSLIGMKGVFAPGPGSVCCVVEKDGQRHLVTASYLFQGARADVVHPGEANTVLATWQQAPGDNPGFVFAKLAPGIPATNVLPPISIERYQHLQFRYQQGASPPKPGQQVVLVGSGSGLRTGTVKEPNPNNEAETLFRSAYPELGMDLILTERISAPMDAGAPVLDGEGNLVGMLFLGLTSEVPDFDRSVIIPIGTIAAELEKHGGRILPPGE